MNSLYTLTSLYNCLADNKFIPERMMSAIRYLTRNVADFILSRELKKIRPRVKVHEPNVVVSLTSFPGRIRVVWKVIQSLKCQEVRPGKIVLWLSKEQFPQDSLIPTELKVLEDDLFEIRLVEGDIRSHKKYYYALQEFPESYIITVDDDIYYHPKTLSFLLDVKKNRPNVIGANITIRLRYQGNVLLSTRKWKGFVGANEDNNLVQIGAGGVLYPPHCLDPIVLNKEVFMQVAPFADDLWLNAASRMAKTPVIQTRSKIVFLPVKVEAPSLYTTNVNQGGNDAQLESIRAFYIKTYGIDPYAYDYSF